VVNVGRFDARSKPLGWRVVNHERPITLLAGIELRHDVADQRKHQRRRIFPDCLQHFKEPVPVVLAPWTAKPTCRGAAIRRSSRRLISPPDLDGHLGDNPGQGDVGVLGASSQGIAAGQSIPFIVLGRFAFAAVFSFWRFTGAFTLSDP